MEEADPVVLGSVLIPHTLIRSCVCCALKSGLLQQYGCKLYQQGTVHVNVCELENAAAQIDQNTSGIAIYSGANRDQDTDQDMSEPEDFQ